MGRAGCPRGGDYGGPDAAAPNAIRSFDPQAGPSADTWDFAYSHGPVMRMVIALGPGDAFAGRNILPGGQSGLNDSEHFTDQVKVWLGNKSWDMDFTPAAVAAGAIGREHYVPGS